MPFKNQLSLRLAKVPKNLRANFVAHVLKKHVPVVSVSVVKKGFFDVVFADAQDASQALKRLASIKIASRTPEVVLPRFPILRCQSDDDEDVDDADYSPEFDFDLPIVKKERRYLCGSDLVY
ncbi:hypothetical protein RCL1_004603 [Eukaryota sp. TZLM3-RCL]